MNFSLDSLGKAALQGATTGGSEKSKCSLLSTGLNYLQSDFGISEGHCLYRKDNEARQLAQTLRDVAWPTKQGLNFNSPIKDISLTCVV